MGNLDARWQLITTSMTKASSKTFNHNKRLNEITFIILLGVLSCAAKHKRTPNHHNHQRNTKDDALNSHLSPTAWKAAAGKHKIMDATRQ